MEQADDEACMWTGCRSKQWLENRLYVHTDIKEDILGLVIGASTPTPPRTSRIHLRRFQPGMIEFKYQVVTFSCHLISIIMLLISPFTKIQGNMIERLATTTDGDIQSIQLARKGYATHRAFSINQNVILKPHYVSTPSSLFSHNFGMFYCTTYNIQKE